MAGFIKTDILKKASAYFQKGNKDTPRSLDTPLPTPPPKNVPRNILAFRTMTKLLSLIQQEQAFQVEWVDPPLDDKELVLSTAFATIAVIEHEVIAVVTKRTYGKLEVICSAEIPPKALPPPPPPPWYLNFFVTSNPRRDDPGSTNPLAGELAIGRADDAGIVPDFDLDDDVALRRWLEEGW
jgi:hypothetical protein